MIRHPLLPSLLLSLTFPLSAIANGTPSCAELAQIAQSISGFVFEDRNRSGDQDPGEPGIAGVSVSNGCDVAVTDSDGFYETRLAAGQILFISQPSGYAVPVDQNNLPQFYYSHYPEGSPREIDGIPVAWRFPVIEPTGPLPYSIDFPLFKLDTTEPVFTAHGFADTQARTEIDQDMLREDLVNTLFGNPYGAAFTLTVGDVVFDNLDLYDRHKEMMGLIGIPNWNLPGNHDLNFESPNSRYATETYKKHFGPPYYSFNYGQVHVVALNNVAYSGASSAGGGKGTYRGFLSNDQLRWLEEDLVQVPKDRLIVLASHIPLIAEATDGENTITGPDTDNFTELLEILRPFEHIYAVAGHDTSNSWKVQVDHTHGWHGRPWIAHTLAEARGAGWHTGPLDMRGVSDATMEDGNPNGFYLLKFDHHSVVPEFTPFPYGPDAIQRMRIRLEPELSLSSDNSIHRGHWHPGTKVVVNLFDGGPRDQLSLSLDNGPPQTMRYVIRTDPFASHFRSKFPELYGNKTDPAKSAHIWEYELPRNLEAGIHSLEVSSIDEFNQERRGVFTFEVLK